VGEPAAVGDPSAAGVIVEVGVAGAGVLHAVPCGSAVTTVIVGAGSGVEPSAGIVPTKSPERGVVRT
jgi:hypothetical protein